MTIFTRLLMLLSILFVAGCATVPSDVDRRDTAGLTAEIMALGPGIDPKEAARAARIAYDYTDHLAQEYEITDPPLVHNTKVNMGLRPRGLCWHWAEDMEARLDRENFQTLVMHRAIANADNPFRIDHSTAIIARRGDDMFDGIVLDPWRYGGVLHWSPTLADTRYNWRPRREVLDAKREQRLSTSSRPAYDG